MLKQSRVVIMSVIVFGVILAYIFDLMQMQVTNGESYRKKSTTATATTIEIPAARGQILDRYGRVLATSAMNYSIIIEKELFPSSKKIKAQNDELLALTDILNEKSEKWADSLPISATAPYTFAADSSKEVDTIIQYYNKSRTKKMPAALSKKATAPQVMTALKALYYTSGYSEAQQRTLCGIRYEMSAKKQDFNYTKSFTFASDVSLETVTKIQERSADLKGIDVEEVSERRYPDGTIAPHVIGLTGKITAETYAKYKKLGYSADEIVGTFGVEQSMEQYLHGKSGSKAIEVNDSGNVIGSTIVDQPQPGDNVVLTIDKDLQTTMQNALPQIINQIKIDSKGDITLGADPQGAAAVVLNVKTGEVLAMATYPSYDLNSYKTDYSALLKDPMTPLLNRCVQGRYRPGSTFKPITATAGLLYNVISPTTVLDCPAEWIKYADRGYTGHDDNAQFRSVDVESALEVSSNVFFDMVGDGVGADRLENVAKNIYGIGKKTGIELNNESAGIMSGPAYNALIGQTGYHPADAAQAAIGQLNTVLTPLQLASYVSTLVNYGTRYQVHIVKQINSADNSTIIKDNSAGTVASKTVLASQIVDTIKEGMRKVTKGDNGTATSMFSSFNMSVGGKTGTAQIPIGKTGLTGYNGVFICFAPYDDPQIAVAVVVQQGHNGFQTAPAAQAGIENYFGLDASGNPVSGVVQTTKVNTLLQ